MPFCTKWLFAPGKFINNNIWGKNGVGKPNGTEIWSCSVASTLLSRWLIYNIYKCRYNKKERVYIIYKFHFLMPKELDNYQFIISLSSIYYQYIISLSSVHHQIYHQFIINLCFIRNFCNLGILCMCDVHIYSSIYAWKKKS